SAFPHAVMAHLCPFVHNVLGAEDVELTVAHSFEHAVRHLFGREGLVRKVGAEPGGVLDFARTELGWAVAVGRVDVRGDRTGTEYRRGDLRRGDGEVAVETLGKREDGVL